MVTFWLPQNSYVPSCASDRATIYRAARFADSPERILGSGTRCYSVRCKEIMVEARFWEWVDAFGANEEGEGWHSRCAAQGDGGRPWRTARGCVGRVCMAAESPVAIINQKGSQPSVSRPAGQPRPALYRVSRGRFPTYLRIRESCLDCHPDNRLKPSTNIQFSGIVLSIISLPSLRILFGLSTRVADIQMYSPKRGRSRLLIEKWDCDAAWLE